MIILTIRTDKPESEIGLFDNQKKLDYEMWQAHRELAETIHKKIDELLKGQGKKLDDVQGIVCFEGPGSFTGLRIGLTVANTLACAQNIPIVARGDPQWLKKGISDLLAGQNDKIALPEYGGEVKTTKPRK
jgi:tRNA threonylcarbamoyladenosine biosynthesis protein TsaB